MYLVSVELQSSVQSRVSLFLSLSLCSSATVFYGAGITLGIVASLLILLYVFSKFVPKVSVVSVLFCFFYRFTLSVSVSLSLSVTLSVCVSLSLSF